MLNGLFNFDYINLFTQHCFLTSSDIDSDPIPLPKQQFTAKRAMLGMDGSPKHPPYLCFHIIQLLTNTIFVETSQPFV